MPFYSASSSDRRERILYAALLLFTENGYANTSVHTIRAHANVSIGLIYRYFKNKEEIALALYRELLSDATENTRQLIKNNDTVADTCHAIIASHFHRTETIPEVVDFILFFRHREMFAEVDAICMAKPAALIIGMLKKAIENGELRKMHPLVAQTAIFGASFRLMQMRILGVLETPLPELLDEVWQCSWLAVKPL